jgi:hypothetical protein
LTYLSISFETITTFTFSLSTICIWVASKAFSRTTV